jgi:acyl dehydratase
MIEKIRAKMGEEIGVSDWLTVTQDRVNRFADATEDHQWIHVDAKRAAAGPFGTTIGHGFLTLSMIPHLAPSLEIEGIKMGINYGLNRVRFISPIPVGSKIRARSKLVDVSEVEGGVQLTNEVTIELENSEKPACVAETLSRLYF